MRKSMKKYSVFILCVFLFSCDPAYLLQTPPGATLSVTTPFGIRNSGSIFDFGSHYFPEIPSATFMLENEGGVPIRIILIELESDGGEFVAASLPINDTVLSIGGSIEFDIDFYPPQIGSDSYSNTLSIQYRDDSDPDAAIKEYTVNLLGNNL
jgi:hypothetical protein